MWTSTGALAARGASLAEFGEVVTKQEQNPDARFIVKTHNINMVPSGSYTAIKITK